MVVGSVLVTGGTGYIGSFTALALLEADYKVVIVDNLVNSSEVVLDRIELICGKRPEFVNLDITDEAALDKVFDDHPDIDSVIHFAALKAVGESSEKPLEYFHTNVYGTLCLLRSMTNHNVTNIVFSSSATVYGDATRYKDMIPIPETCPLGPTNPYGNTKLTVEMMIKDWINAERAKARKNSKNEEVFNAALLRYFNPAGAHPSGSMGEDPKGKPNNLLPFLAQLAVGKQTVLEIFGDDYDTDDGTPIRDYIHILDLSRGHLSALNYLHSDHPGQEKWTGVREWNLGTGKGSSVYQMLKAFQDVVGHDLENKVSPRRAGDVLNLTAKVDRAREELGWETELTLEQACEDLWRWTKNNPDGYDPPEASLDAPK